MAAEVTLENLGKSYNFDWIFRKINLTLTAEKYAVVGGNGSGKSTFLKVVAGAVYPSEGKLLYKVNNTVIEKEKAHTLISLAAPYQALFEDFTFKESIEFQSKFKPFINNLSTNEITELTGLQKAANKPMKYFSSGMKQRAKLALAIVADTPILLLDEPATNLDKKGIEWYQDLVKQYCNNRMVLVCSNRIDEETGFCTGLIEIEKYK